MRKNGKLALTRKENQSITITTTFGEEITVSLYRIDGEQATLTIEADLDTEIVRCELLYKLDDTLAEEHL